VADIARRYGATRWQIYDWCRRFRRGLLAAPKEDVASTAFVPLTVDDDLQRMPHADIVEVAIGDILIRGTRHGRGAFGADFPRGARVVIGHGGQPLTIYLALTIARNHAGL
jgi:hypothetical protein